MKREEFLVNDEMRHRDEVRKGPRRRGVLAISSPRIQVLLQLPVKVLMRPDVEDFHQVALGVELVGEEELLRTDLELDDADTLEGTNLGRA